MFLLGTALTFVAMFIFSGTALLGQEIIVEIRLGTR